MRRLCLLGPLLCAFAVSAHAQSNSAAMVSYLPLDNSLGVLSTGDLSASGQLNVLSLACQIPINDGGKHTVGTAPSTSCFYGKTTLAALAAITINGVTPFSFLTDGGVLDGPMGTPGSQANPFTSASGSYKLTDAAVPNLDIAWLAGQAAVLSGNAYFPNGTYIVGSTQALPIMIPLSFDGGATFSGTPSHIAGDGVGRSILKAGSDFGAGVPLMSCGDPSATTSNLLGRFNGNYSDCYGSTANLTMTGPGSSWFWSPGQTLYQMDGFAPGAHNKTLDVEVAGFNHNWLIDGDHTTHVRPMSRGGAHGYYWDGPNFALYGDIDFVALNSTGASMDAIEVGPNASLSGDFLGLTYLSAPYAVRGDASASGTSLVGGAHFTRLFSESIAYAVFADDTGFSGGGYIDAKKTRSISNLLIDDWNWSWSNSKWITGSGRQRRAAIDVSDMSAVISGLQSDTGLQAPNTLGAPSGESNTPVAVFNIHTVNGGLFGLKLSGNINNLIAQAGSLPLFPPNLAVSASISLEQPGMWSGGVAQLYQQGTYTTTGVGDLLQPYNYQGAVPGGSNPANTVLGVVMQGGLKAGSYQTGAIVPYASAGNFINVNTGADTGGAGAYGMGTGIGAQLVLTGGSGYTVGMFNWTATGGGCTVAPKGTVTVVSGMLSSYKITMQGLGCTSAPAIAVPAGAGAGTGGAIAPVWPGALAFHETALALPIVGSLNQGGTGIANLKLQGMN